MFKKYFNIEELKDSDYKNFHTFANNKYYMVELYSSKEINNLKVDKLPDENIRHDVMSYGDDNYVGKFITNYQTIKFLALNESDNKIYKTCEKRDKKGNITNIYQYTQPVCLVENKTQYLIRILRNFIVFIKIMRVSIKPLNQ
jgi:hypothetical protein